ncbi:MAG: AAA family ATPase [Actinomycetota bacterium]
MYLRELSLRNYRVFGQVDLELPSRVIGIFGPNGAGKSALVGSILFGLFGIDRTAKDQIRTHGVLTDCEVRIAFEHGGRTYEVRVPGGRPPDLVTVYDGASPRQDRLQAVELKLADSVPSAWWNLWLQWGGLYLIAAMIVALLLRRLMKVQ